MNCATKIAPLKTDYTVLAWRRLRTADKRKAELACLRTDGTDRKAATN
jgi:hypothetical protein